MNRKELDKINKLAGAEFGYEGSTDPYMDQNYIGTPGEYDFGGNGVSFAAEHAPGRVFTFEIVAGTGQDEVIALCPAYYDSLSRLSTEGHSDVTAIFGDGAILSRGTGNDLTCTSKNSGKTIFGFLEFIKRNPVRVVGMSMQSSTATQFDQIIKVENVSPIDDLGNKQIVLSRYRPASQLATDKIDADLLKNDNVMDFNDQNLIKLPVKDGATITVNLFLGAISNEAARLAKKAGMAHANLRRHYPHLCK